MFPRRSVSLETRIGLTLAPRRNESPFTTVTPLSTRALRYTFVMLTLLTMLTLLST
ncbi:MAG: hypothetical protein LC126_23720 [Bryobacterales bacterium]|nr:hypothetical protein [Bryobacterales bacterium]